MKATDRPSVETNRTLGELSIEELINKAERNLQYAADIIAGREDRYTKGQMSDGGPAIDLLSLSIASARAELIVAQNKRPETRRDC
jgi:hypothetical protein